MLHWGGVWATGRYVYIYIFMYMYKYIFIWVYIYVYMSSHAALGYAPKVDWGESYR